MRINRLSCVLVVCGLFACATNARAEVLVYNLVPAQSSLTVSGTFGNQTLTPQTAGSTTTSYSGTIVANVGATTISFPGGSAINAANQGSNQQPGNEGLPGSAQANYGFQANLAPFGTGFAVIRGFTLDITSNAINFAGTSIPSEETFAVSTGNLDFSSSIAFDRRDMSGDSGGNATAAAGSLISGGPTQTLTIPVNFTVTESTITTNDTVLTFTGTLVATRVVPEPASIAGCSLLAFASLLRRR